MATPTLSTDAATKAYVDSNSSGSSSSVPIGTILMWSNASAPTGYLLCDGASYNTTTYNSLYTVLGTSYVPDFRGYFVRGYDSTQTVDTEVRNLLST